MKCTEVSNACKTCDQVDECGLVLMDISNDVLMTRILLASALDRMIEKLFIDLQGMEPPLPWFAEAIQNLEGKGLLLHSEERVIGAALEYIYKTRNLEYF